MMGSTHMATGLIISTFITTNPVGVVLGTVAALLPDIDEPNSMISKRIPIIPHIIGLFGHRKITHSLIGLFLFSIPIFLFFSNEMLLVFIAGYLSHLVLDTLTKMGVPWGYPIIQKHYSLSLGRSGGVVERVYILALFAVVIFLGVEHFVPHMEQIQLLFSSNINFPF